MRSDEDTIFAPATAPGRAAVGIIRVSGIGARRLGDIFDFALPKPRRAGLRTLHLESRQLDQALVLFFPGPGSYTGEDLVELQIHGGRAVYDSILDGLAGEKGFRFAEPGEFSRRAVLNGRLDLIEAEAVNDLVNAETEAQRDLALTQLRGSLSRVFEGWATNLTRGRAHLEAYIDFPDEDLPDEIAELLAMDLAKISAEMAGFLDDDRRGERLRDGMRIAVVGPPNAGKSSFVNWLAQRDVAIVSEQAGTTRDVIEVHLNLSGYPVIVADTAGVRESADKVEAEGIRRARAWSEQSDLRILVLDAMFGGDGDPFGYGVKEGDLVLLNKIDLLKADGSLVSAPTRDRRPLWVPVSMVTGEGLGDVMDRLSSIARDRMNISSRPVLSRARHRSALRSCLDALNRSVEGIATNVELEIVAENLRIAADGLGRVTGRVDVEDLLDVVFRDFCIGK